MTKYAARHRDLIDVKDAVSPSVRAATIGAAVLVMALLVLLVL